MERQWHSTPVLLPGESQGRGTLVGCHLWGRTESDLAAAMPLITPDNCPCSEFYFAINSATPVFFWIELICHIFFNPLNPYESLYLKCFYFKQQVILIFWSTLTICFQIAVFRPCISKVISDIVSLISNFLNCFPFVFLTSFYVLFGFNWAFYMITF